MSEWRTVHLAEVAREVTVGHVGPMASEYQPDGVPFLRSQNVLPFRIDLDDVKYISPEFHARLSKSALRPGDVITVRTGKPGTTALVPWDWTEANCSDLVITRPGPELDARWLTYYMNAATGYVASHIVGAVQQHFNVGAAKSMTLLLPTVVEQQAIAEVLGALDDKIAANAKAAVMADELLASTFDTLLAEARLQDPMELSSVADINPEQVRPTADGWLRYVDISSVEVGHFIYPERTEWASAPSRARRRIRHGDIIWSTVRPNRRSHALNLDDDDDLIASTGLAVIRPRLVGRCYLYEALRRPEFTAYLEGVAEGSAYPAVRPERFAEALLPAVASADREEFEAFASPIRDAIHNLELQSRTLATLRDTLLPALMSGTLRVRDAEKSIEAVV